MFGSGFVNTATSATIYAKLPETMRAKPTVAFSNLRLADGTGTPAVTALTTNRSTLDTMGVFLAAAGGGLTTGRAVALLADNTTSAWLDFNARL
jgi:hypothetical protein